MEKVVSRQLTVRETPFPTQVDDKGQARYEFRSC
jgi:hypothetical protein